MSAELIRALNLIDAVFADDPDVREAWTQYFAALNDQNMNSGIGGSIREAKRRELLPEMVKALELAKKISSADLLRTYVPNFIAEDTHVAILERIHKKAVLEEQLTQRHIDFPRWPEQAPPAPSIPQPTGSSAGNGAKLPQ
jgi:hypothetical protein